MPNVPVCDCPPLDEYHSEGCPLYDARPGAVAIPDEPTGPTGTPLRLTPTPALTFALGYVVTQPVRAEEYGGICALVEELMSRPWVDGDLVHGGGQYAALLDILPPEVARRITTLYQMQRAQRWAATGRR